MNFSETLFFVLLILTVLFLSLAVFSSNLESRFWQIFNKVSWRLSFVTVAVWMLIISFSFDKMYLMVPM